MPCEAGTFQPVWGQTSCWTCPPNTTTDSVGAASPASCKHTACVHHSRPGLAILQSPNYPASLPRVTSCHWRVEPGPGVAVLLILPSLALPPGCSHTLTVRRGPRTVFSSCQATDGPLLVTSQVVQSFLILIRFLDISTRYILITNEILEILHGPLPLILDHNDLWFWSMQNRNACDVRPHPHSKRFLISFID